MENQIKGRSKRYFWMPAVLMIGILLTGCMPAEPEPVPTQVTPEFPSEPPATFTPPAPTPEMSSPSVTPQPTISIPNTGAGLVAAGEEIFIEACAACHQMEGQGADGLYPPLNGSGFVTAQDPQPLIRVIITGRGGMPTFHTMLSSAEIAAVVSYIRGAWDNQAGPVEVGEVEQVWQDTGLPLPDEEAEEEE